MARSEELQVVVRAVDEASVVLKKIHGDLEKMGVNAQQTTTHIDALGNKLTSLGQRIKEGFGAGIGFAVFNEIDKGFHDLLGLYPQIIGMGSGYLEQLHMIQLETGMTAEQTSVLVGAAKNLGINVDNLEPLFAKLGKNLGTNEGKFRDLGVATRDANGNMLGAYQIIDNLRHQVSKHGEALLSTAAAQELFGRGGYQLLALLQQSDPQWKESIANVERWGGVMSQQAVAGAHRFGVEMASLQTGILDTATNIFAALSPYLSAFVDAFAKFVQSHLQEIINFAVQVASTVMGILGGLFGFSVDFTKATSEVAGGTYKAAAATDTFGKSANTAQSNLAAFTKGIQEQIKAIDAHIAALTAAAQKRKAIEEEEKLRKSLSDARSQLKDLQGNTPFLGGLSAAEQVLAMQKHAQDIADAKKAVGAAQESLGNFQLDQRDQAERALLERQKARLSDELAAHKAANAAILNSGLQMTKGLDTGASNVFKNLGIDTAKFALSAQASFKAGADAGRAFMDVLLGAQGTTTDQWGHMVSGRSGGVVGALAGLGVSFSGLKDVLGFVGDAAHWAEGGLNAVQKALSSLGKTSVEDALNRARADAGLPPIPHAAGGSFSAGDVSLVGENGPEIRVESGSGYYIPNNQLSGGGGGGGGGQPIVIKLMLDGKQITQVVTREFYYQLNHSPVTSNPAGSF